MQMHTVTWLMHSFALHTQMNSTVDEGFACNSQGFADLRNKLRAYETLDKTALSLKEYFTNSNSSCM